MKIGNGFIEVQGGWVYAPQVVAIEPSGVLCKVIVAGGKEYLYYGSCQQFAIEMTSARLEVL